MRLESTLTLTALAAALGFAWATGAHRPSWKPEAEVAERPVELPRDGYVSSDACRACHPREYDAWHGSHHRTMTQVATPATVVGDFGDVELAHEGLVYRLRREGDEFLVRVGSGAPGSAVERKVVLTTGAHHQQVYWVATGQGRALGALPFAHLVADDRWVPLDSIFLKPLESVRASPAGEWNQSCIRCHTTHQRPRAEGFARIDTHVSEFGIACEACHGPGAEHVAANRNPLRRYGLHAGDEVDRTIRQPERLDHDGESQICAQCHAVTLRTSAEHERWQVRGHSFRPGDELRDSQLVVRAGESSEGLREILATNPSFLEDRFWSDGMIRVAGREYNGLLESPCFQRGELACSSCHSMHRAPDDPRPNDEWADDQLRFPRDGDDACLQCHAELADAVRLARHSHHAAGSRGSACMDCHMPYTAYSLLKATRSHQIDSPSVEASLSTGRPNACNLCHLDRSLAWTARHLSEWYGIASPQIGERHGERHDARAAPAASVEWILTGDAGQRALVAWSMGWTPAREASGADWTAPFLAHLLLDPYPAVRYGAVRSLATLPEASGLALDHLASDERRAAWRAELLERWRRGRSASDGAARESVLPARESVLIGPDGDLLVEEFEALARRRDDRTVNLAE